MVRLAVSAPISIHALREEGDGRQFYRGCFQKISIHALREEGDAGGFRSDHPLHEFLSTPSARRATPVIGGGYGYSEISIHALREEGDPSWPSISGNQRKFLSTPSARRATCA